VVAFQWYAAFVLRRKQNGGGTMKLDLAQLESSIGT
jgi:hypothetical protein